MEKSTYLRISSGVLFIHGLIEILAITMFALPPELIPVSLIGDAGFWALIGAMYGIFRMVSSLLISKRKKSGLILGIIISVVTLVVAPNIQPFGLLDLPLAMVVLWGLVSVWFGDDIIDGTARA